MFRRNNSVHHPEMDHQQVYEESVRHYVSVKTSAEDPSESYA